MAEENKVTLHGYWASPYSKIVELALKFKGIPFEYVEEDLMNKSSLLLKYNPVHKKVPVLVHNGKPIAESLVILEYIDETWKDGRNLLPEDPYKRALVRFWSGFLQQQFETVLLAYKTEGEAQEKATKELHEKFKVFEEKIKELFPDGRSIIDSNDVGVLDFVLLSLCGAHKVQSEVVGIKVIDPEKTPLVVSWIAALVELPLVKELTPPHDKTVEFLRSFRNAALKTPVS
uniref:Glutathione S-transferase n=1 Tax=Ziziphus jujuba TaxID=326968 RepID=A0A6P3YVZ6_ZIZJJ|nr:glutathione S-transferase U9-like [Ziziphus jujuba var. spinosa]